MANAARSARANASMSPAQASRAGASRISANSPPVRANTHGAWAAVARVGRRLALSALRCSSVNGTGSDDRSAAKCLALAQLAVGHVAQAAVRRTSPPAE